MKNISLLLVLLLLLSFAPRQYAYKPAAIAGPANVVDTNTCCQVIELFTSEGCSSCPAADKLLENINSSYQHKLIVLGFHVDYWNRLGWKDRFSNASYSDRQRRYATVIPNGEVYTPQAVINGTEQIVGSDRSKLLQLINQPKKSTPAMRITATAKMEGNAVHVSCQYAGGNNSLLNIAVVLVNAETQVLAGENRGLALHHVNVVRAFKTISEPFGGAVLELPEKGMAKEYRVVVYAQDRKTMRVIGSSDYVAVQ